MRICFVSEDAFLHYFVVSFDVLERCVNYGNRINGKSGG